MGDETVEEAVTIGQDLIAKTKQQIELMGRALPHDTPPASRRAMAMVATKLDEARLWLGEVAR